MYIQKLEVKQHVSALYGPHQVFLFPPKVSLYKLRCGDLPSDYNSSMPMYIYIFILSLLVGGGCHPWGVSCRFHVSYVGAALCCFSLFVCTHCLVS